MRSQIITSLCIVWMMFQCATGQSQTALPYFSGFDNVAEKAGWTEYRLGAVGLNKWSYSMSFAFSDPECLRHGYPVGGTELTDDWFVSPEFDFTAGAMIDSLRYSFTGFGTPMSGDTIGVYLLNGSPDPADATLITMLYSFTDSIYINDGVWRKTVPIDIPATTGQSYLAFRYSTVVNWLDTKIDNVSISGEPVGTNSAVLSNEVILAYPNPSQNYISLKMIDNLSITSLQLVDLQGRVVRNFETDQNILAIDGLAFGHYVLKIATDRGQVNKKIIVK